MANQSGFHDSDSEDNGNDLDRNDNILSLSFNQDGGCLAVGTQCGFRIYNVNPFQETFRRTFVNSPPGNLSYDSNNGSSSSPSKQNQNNENNTITSGGGVGKVEMLFRCNLLALVGGGMSPRYPPNKVMIWDDHRGKCIGELSFRQKVLSVKMRRDRIAVALTTRVYLYNFSDLRLLDTIHTTSNPQGLLSLSTATFHNSPTTLACPSLTKGEIRVEDYTHRHTSLISAHESPVVAMELSMDGALLATASGKGTIIRVFHSRKETRLYEFRRGVEWANILCLSFNMDKQWLACCSDRGTTHIFQLKDSEKDGDASTDRRSSGGGETTEPSPKPKKKSKGFASFLPSPLAAVRNRVGLDGLVSYAQVRGIDHPMVCAFAPDRPNTLAVIGRNASDGGGGGSCSVLISDFTRGGSDCDRVAYHRFFRKKGDREGEENMSDVIANISPVETTNVRCDDDEEESDGLDGIVFREEEEGFISVNPNEENAEEEDANEKKEVTNETSHGIDEEGKRSSLSCSPSNENNSQMNEDVHENKSHLDKDIDTEANDLQEGGQDTTISTDQENSKPSDIVEEKEVVSYAI